jgi:hypothetical protein
MSTRFAHDPNAVLDYAFDWSGWLAEDETIATFEVLTGDDITVDSSYESDGKVTVWLSGASARNVPVTCRITTTDGRTDDRTLTLVVADR